MHRDTDSNVKIDITNALYLLSNYVKNQNCAKCYSKTQDVQEFQMFKDGQNSEHINIFITLPEMVKKI